MAGYIDLVDPELRAAAVLMREGYADFVPMTKDKLRKRRQWLETRVTPPLPDVAFEMRRIPHLETPADGAGVPIYIVNMQAGSKKPGIFHIHGGGLTASSAMASMRNVQELALLLDCPIVTVEYRLAPEARWFESGEDNYAALLWTYRHAAEIGIDPARIALLGESAGGAHAALLSIAARDRGEVPLAFQALIYPMLDDRTGSSRKVPEHLGYFGWNPDSNAFGWKSFLGMTPGGPDVPAAAVPARVKDLSGLPPTFIGAAALDVLAEENIEFAGRLVAAGVPTELVLMPGALHGFDMLVKEARISRHFTARKIEALRRGLGLAEAEPAR